VNTTVCPFCDAPEMVLENTFAFVRWDLYAVSPGHALIIPKRHFPDYFDCTNDEQQALWSLVEEAKKLIDKQYAPDGYNIGINAGLAAGQTVPHLHIHLIPRYIGDMKDPKGGVRGVIPSRQKY
jgi:diadenosine tetraphosphate (Ap4A) HIT family hydrolase